MPSRHFQFCILVQPFSLSKRFCFFYAQYQAFRSFHSTSRPGGLAPNDILKVKCQIIYYYLCYNREYLIFSILETLVSKLTLSLTPNFHPYIIFITYWSTCVIIHLITAERRNGKIVQKAVRIEYYLQPNLSSRKY